MAVRRVRVAMVGLGNVGRHVVGLLASKSEVLRSRYNITPVLVMAADSSGVAMAPRGLDPDAVVQVKAAKQGVASLPRVGEPGVSAAEALRHATADVLLEAAPTNLIDGEPGLGCIRLALRRGMHVVTADKGPLILSYADVMRWAQRAGRTVLFSATVGGGLPSVNVGRRDLGTCTINRIEAILNSTTNSILTAMAEEGKAFADALADAQRSGVAEADPTLDIEGYDAAGKLVILANAVLGMNAHLRDVERMGITGVTREDMAEAAARGERIKLLCRAERQPTGSYALSVKPTPIPLSHPLARLSGEALGIVYETDINGSVMVTISDRGPMGTAAAMLRDLVNVVGP